MEKEVSTVIITIAIPVLSFFGALLGAWIHHRRNIVFKKKELISSAYKVAMDHIEVLYRIKRRSNDPEHREADTIKIRDDFHQIQIDIAYYQSMLSLESSVLGTAYRELIATIKNVTADKIQQAWKEDGNIAGQYDDVIDDSEMDRIQDKKDKFLQIADKFINKKL